MPDSPPDSLDTNASIWKSDEVVKQWVSGATEREQSRVTQWRLMGELLPFAQEDRFTFLDLGAGTGAAAKAILGLYPRSEAVLTDYSSQMIEQGGHALAEYEGRFRYVEFDMLGEAWPDAVPDTLDAVVTSLCVHHLPDARKQTLFREIFDRLVPGGWYLNFDPVTSADPVVAAAWDRATERQDPAAAEKALHRTPEEHARYENHVRYMIPLEPQLAWLAAAGFEAVDVFWKHLEWVIYGGRRPPAGG